MDVLVGIANLVVLLFIIEAWVKGRIPGVLARTTSEHVDERFSDPASPANVRLDGLDTRLGALDTRLDGLDTRLDALDTRLDGLETSQQIGDLDRRVRERLRGLQRRERAPEAEGGGTAEGPS